MRNPTDLCSHWKQGARGMGSCERRVILDNNFCFLLSAFCLCACSSATPPPSSCPLPLLQEFPSCSHLILNPSRAIAFCWDQTRHWGIMWQRKVAINIVEPFGQEGKKVREAQGGGGGGAETKTVQEQDKLEWSEEREKGRVSRECGGRGLCRSSRWFWVRPRAAAQWQTSVRSSRGMESSDSRAQEPRPKPALWGGTPEYDYVCFEKCSRFGIPVEAGHETGATGDGLRSPENSLSYPQVGLDNGTFVQHSSPWDHTGTSLGPSERRWQSTHPCPSPVPPARPSSCWLQARLSQSWLCSNQGSYQQFKSAGLSPAMDTMTLGMGKLGWGKLTRALMHL